MRKMGTCDGCIWGGHCGGLKGDNSHGEGCFDGHVVKMTACVVVSERNVHAAAVVPVS
jgi:hypothetical protein